MSQPSALITGASRGIGFAIAQTLAADGYALTVTSRRANALAEAVGNLERTGTPVQALAGNLANEEDVKAIVSAHRERYGRLDLLVNNGGMGILGGIDGYKTEHMDLQYEVNLRAIALFYRESLDILKATAAEAGCATVINVASISGKVGEGGLSLYSAVKHGVVGFTQAMNQELLPSHVRSCVLCPAFVDTSLSDYAKHQIPASKMIQPDDIARAVRFVAGLSVHCVVPEIIFENDGVGGASCPS
jgi:NAD(P)-dependent dehydrogenase (short-subunit alcohol dehydrogenase family)